MFNEKTKQNPHFVIIIALSTAIIMFAGVLTPVFGWGNGGKNRTKYQAKIATEAAFSSPELFTLNTLPVTSGPGYGIGTHDLILEQA
ncbi:MAG: hypothetical protein LBN35_04610, partial [Clostridiales Family XIII bacterium]|nr:hypothetical protein [Clostridiales Family XIII bacterium]